MVLIVVRHAKAEEKSDFAKRSDNDWLRPLTEDGRTRMKKVANRLAQLMPRLDHLVASPLVRAQQTAEILQEKFNIGTVEIEKSLAPGGQNSDILKFLRTRITNA